MWISGFATESSFQCVRNLIADPGNRRELSDFLYRQRRQSKVCTVNFVATGTTTTLSISGLQGIDYIGLDNIDLEPASTVTPEPSNIALSVVAISMLLLGARNRLAALFLS